MVQSAKDKSETVLQKGDYIVYHYNGSFLEHDVNLTEEIVERIGLRLTMKVTIDRGEQINTWYQVVVDTPENREQNNVEELYRIIDGEKKILTGDKEIIILSLYEWVLPPQGEIIGETVVTSEDVILPHGRTVTAKCSHNKQIIDGRSVDTKHCFSPEFLWYHISYTMACSENRQVLFAMRILDCGP